MIRSLNFLLTLVAVVAATLLVTPLPAVAETEAPSPPSVTPPEVESLPIGAAGLAPTATCSGARTTRSTAADLDPDCIYGCEREERRCLTAARNRRESNVCRNEYHECNDRCFAGELDPDRPWYDPWNPSTPPDRGPGNDCATPGAEGCDEIQNHDVPGGGAAPRDTERPRRPHPHSS